MVVERRDRGQLLLVSAIALAFIILGYVVVLNGVLYTQAVSSGNTLEDATDADGSAVEVRRGVAGVAQSVNRGQYDDEGDLDDAVEANASAFASRYTNVTSDSRASIVNLSATNVTEHGWLVAQSEQDQFNDTAGEWDLYNTTGDPETHSIEQFVVTINVSASNFGDDFTVELENGSETQTMTFENDSGTLDVSIDGGPSCEFDGTRADGTIEFDLVSGRVNGGERSSNCSIVSGLEEPYERLTFEDGNEVVGTYEIVFSEGSNSGFGADVSFAAVVVEVDYRYQSDAVSLERTLEVDVYGGNR